MIRATLRRVAPAQTLPRGESGPEAGDGSVAQTCSSVLPRRNPHRFRTSSCFQEQNTGISFRACPRSQNAKMPRRAFCAGAFLRDFLAGYPVLPTQQSILSRIRVLAPYAVRQQREKHRGEFRENQAGVDCDPLQLQQAPSPSIQGFCTRPSSKSNRWSHKPPPPTSADRTSLSSTTRKSLIRIDDGRHYLMTTSKRFDGIHRRSPRPLGSRGRPTSTPRNSFSP